MSRRSLAISFTTAVVANTLVIIGWLVVASPSNYAWRHVDSQSLGQIRYACDSIFRLGLVSWLIPLNLAFAALLCFAWRRVLAGTLALLAILLAVFGYMWAERMMTPHYLALFERQAVDEASLTKPITSGGRAIGPLVLARISDKACPRRGYAILGLGDLRYAPAIPVLDGILTDQTEDKYIRHDAFRALSAIGTHDALASLDRFWRQVDPDRDSSLLKELEATGLRRPALAGAAQADR